MGAEQPGLKKHPNCTAGSGDRTANKTTGSHDGRRIGIATSSSLDGEPPRDNVAGMGCVLKGVPAMRVSLGQAPGVDWTRRCSGRMPLPGTTSMLATLRRESSNSLRPLPRGRLTQTVAVGSIIHKNGSVLMMYKGRGKRAQHMGLAFAPSVDGPYTRNGTGQELPNLPGEDPWVSC